MIGPIMPARFGLDEVDSGMIMLIVKTCMYIPIEEYSVYSNTRLVQCDVTIIQDLLCSDPADAAKTFVIKQTTSKKPFQ